jgi:hypothetical protein
MLSRQKSLSTKEAVSGGLWWWAVMQNNFHKVFNKEVDGYRLSLLYCADQREWNSFKQTAGRLFDYLEAVEMTETEKKFFKIFRSVLISLFIMTVLIFRMNFDIHPDIQRVREVIILIAIAGCCFELYFFMTFRMYMEKKNIFYKKRKEKFIRDIERDFKEV